MLVLFDRVVNEIENCDEKYLMALVEEAEINVGPYGFSGCYVDLVIYDVNDDADEIYDPEDYILLAWRYDGEWQSIPKSNVYHAIAELGFNSYGK